MHDVFWVCAVCGGWLAAFLAVDWAVERWRAWRDTQRVVHRLRRWRQP